MGGFPFAAIVIATLSAVVAVVAAVIAARGLPRSLIRRVDDLTERCVASEHIVEGMEARVTRWRMELQGVLEGLDTQMERLETKRRSATAAATRASKVSQEAVDPMNVTDPAQLLQMARDSGAWGE